MNKKIVLKPEVLEERLDVFLAKNYKEYSRGYFQRLIDMGLALVNSEKVVPSYRIKENDQVELEFLVETSTLKAEKIPIEIIYEDTDIIIVNKKPGIVVHPACGHPAGTLLNALAGHFNKKAVPYLVHRLDKDTSGVMIIAKNEKTKASLVRQFQSRTVKKEYIAAVKGQVNEDAGRIEAPLGRSPQDRRKIIVGPLSKKMAITDFKVLRRGSDYSVIEAHPITGRTHQIRSHFSYIGHPLLGDETYGGPLKSSHAELPRHMLHAHKVSFVHPKTGKRIEFSAPIPKDMQWMMPTQVKRGKK